MLLDYKMEDFQALNAEGLGYILTVRIVSWWGLSDKICRMKVQVPFNVCAEAFYKPKLNVWRTEKSGKIDKGQY